MSADENTKRLMRSVGVQVTGGLLMLVFGIITVLEDYMRVLLKKEGPDLSWHGMIMFTIGCLLIGATTARITGAVSTKRNQ